MGAAVGDCFTQSKFDGSAFEAEWRADQSLCSVLEATSDPGIRKEYRDYKPGAFGGGAIR